jgi:hypothetical protein
MIVASLCGVTSPKDVSRSICAMGHKWMWNAKWDGLPSDAFLSSVDPLLSEMREKLAGRYETSDHIAGLLSAKWAARLGLRAGIPIPVGALDAHWDAVAANIRLGMSSMSLVDPPASSASANNRCWCLECAASSLAPCCRNIPESKPASQPWAIYSMESLAERDRLSPLLRKVLNPIARGKLDSYA